MAEKVHINKDGLQVMDWSAGAQQYVPTEDPPIRSLRSACYIDEGTTLGDIFKAVGKYKDLAAFIANWSWCDPEAFHAEAQQPASQPSDLEYLELSKGFDWQEDGAGEYLSFNGIGPDDQLTGTVYSIAFSPVNELAHLPVRLKSTMSISRDHVEIGKAPCTFSLLDVLGEIYFEVSFHGSPASRDKHFRELKDAMEDVKEGRAALVPLNLGEGETIQ